MGSFFNAFTGHNAHYSSLTSGMSFTIHSIWTMSTTNHRTKITITSQPIKMQNSSKCLQVKVTGIDIIHRHKATTSATNCSPATAKIKGYLGQRFRVRTLSLLSHPVIALRVDHPIIDSAAHKCFHLLMEFRGPMRRDHQVQNTGER